MSGHDRDFVRRVFERAEQGLEPDAERLAQRAHAWMSDARRRAQPPEGDFLTELVALARVALPRFAVGTAVLAMISLGLWIGTDTTSTATLSGATTQSSVSSGHDLDKMMLGTGTSTGGDDILLQAIVGIEGNDG